MGEPHKSIRGLLRLAFFDSTRARQDVSERRSRPGCSGRVFGERKPRNFLGGGGSLVSAAGDIFWGFGGRQNEGFSLFWLGCPSVSERPTSRRQKANSAALDSNYFRSVSLFALAEVVESDVQVTLYLQWCQPTLHQTAPNSPNLVTWQVMGN